MIGALRVNSNIAAQHLLDGPDPRAKHSTSPQACWVAVEDRSAGFAHAKESGAPTSNFALRRLRATSVGARARSAEQPRTPGAFANAACVAELFMLDCVQ